MRNLIIASHPDDEVLGCGGTIPRLVQEGQELFVLVLGEGITSRYNDRKQAQRGPVNELREKSRSVAELLGIKEIYFEAFPDNRFDTVPLLDIVKSIEGCIAKVMPQAIYTQFGGDLNIDHTMTFRATLTATRPGIDNPVKEVYAYEVPSSTEWTFSSLPPAFHPNVFVDISSTLDRKIKAMHLYASELRPFPHPRSPEALGACARKWGSVVGVDAAEAFQLIRLIR